MLTDTLFRVPRASGLQVLHARGGPGGARELTTSRLCLDAGQSANYVEDGAESVVVLQQGRGRFETPQGEWEVSRASVFAERATALLLPPNVPLTVRATSALEAVIIATPSSAPGTVALMSPADVVVNQRGRGTYAREVHDIFVRDP